jgi:hypothetical protein
VNLESGVVIDAQVLSGGELPRQTWETYRAFDAERNLAAGATLQISPSANTSTKAQLVGLNASNVDRTRRIFYSIELRLVAPDGKVVHARHFLPQDDYLPEDMKILRRADGTGIFIVKAGGSSSSPFLVGHYRLKLTYHRNNKARVSTSQIFSQAGDQADEIVMLDIPVQTK